MIPPSDSPRLWKADPWFYSLTACFLWIILLSTHLINDTDLGFHLKGGQWILENHQFPSHDLYTYTVSDHDYLDIHWFYQVCLYLSYKVGGFNLISLLHTGLIFLVFLFTFKRLELAGSPLWSSTLFLTAAAWASEMRFRTRPEVLSWLLFTLTLWVLELRSSRKRDLIFLLPALQLVWVNCEGLFILGWGLMGFFCVSDLFHNQKTDWKLFIYSFLSAAACLVNPYFLKGVLFPFTLLKTIGSPSIFKYGVKELQSPWPKDLPGLITQPFSYWLYELFALALLALLLGTIHRRKVHEILIACSFFALSFSSMRNISFFMIACVPIAAVCLGDLRKNGIQKNNFNQPIQRSFGWVFLFFLIGFSLRIATNAYFISNHRSERFGIGLDRELQPVQACEFLVQNHLDGKILNTLDAGDWLDWKGPQKTYIDGRLEVMGGDLFWEYTASLLPGGLPRLLDKYQVDILFFNPLYSVPWAQDLQTLKNWRLVYEDGLIVIYLRRGYGDGVPDLDYGKLREQQGVSNFQPADAASSLQMTPPSSLVRYAEEFYKYSEYPNNLQNIGIFNLQNHHSEVSEPFFLEAIRRSQGRYPGLYLNLGDLYYSNKRYPEARLCAEKVLREEPENPMALQLLERIPRISPSIPMLP